MLAGLKLTHRGGKVRYNTGETSARASLKWRAVRPKEISVSDLLEETGAPASDTVELPAYAVRTLRAELK